MPTPEQNAAHADIMVGVRTKDDARTLRGRRNLAAANIAADIRRRLAVAPPLTSEQVEYLSGLLNGGAR